MDANECNTVIAAARNLPGMPMTDILSGMSQAGAEFGRATQEQFGRNGEW